MDFSFTKHQILNSRFYSLGCIPVDFNGLLEKHKMILQTMYSGKGNVSIIGVKVDKPCFIEFQIATESNYGYVSTLSELRLINDNGVYSYMKIKDIGQSSTNARITSIYYEYTEDISKILYFGVFDRNLGIYDIRILK